MDESDVRVSNIRLYGVFEVRLWKHSRGQPLFPVIDGPQMHRASNRFDHTQFRFLDRSADGNLTPRRRDKS